MLIAGAAPDQYVKTFHQALDIQHGTLITEYTDSSGSNGRIIAFASRADRSLVVFRYEGAAANLSKRIKKRIATSGTYPGVNASISVSEVKDAGATTILCRIDSPVSPLAVQQTAQKSYETLLSEHEDKWEQAWKSDIIIDGDTEAQRVIQKTLL